MGRLALPAPHPARHGPAGRRAQPALRAAAGARRGQALLAGQRRGRQAAPLRRRLAGRPPRAGADRPPLPRPQRRPDPRGARRGWPSSATTPTRRSSRTARRRWPSPRSAGCSLNTQRHAAVLQVLDGRRRRQRDRPRLRTGPVPRACWPTSRRSPGSPAPTCPPAPWPQAERRLRLERWASGSGERITVPGRPDLRGPAVRRVRRRRADGGHRARRPAAARRAGAGGVRCRPAGPRWS